MSEEMKLLYALCDALGFQVLVEVKSVTKRKLIDVLDRDSLFEQWSKQFTDIEVREKSYKLIKKEG